MPAGVSKPKSHSDILNSYSTQNPVSFEDQQNRTDYFQALNALAKSPTNYKTFYDKLSSAEQNNYQIFKANKSIQELSSTATRKSNAITTWNRIKHTVLSKLGNKTSKAALITIKKRDQDAKTLARYAKISAALLELEEPLSEQGLNSFLESLKSSEDDLANTIFTYKDSAFLVNKLGSDVIIKLFNTYVNNPANATNPKLKEELIKQILTAIQDPEVSKAVATEIQPAPITTENSSAGMKVNKENSAPKASKPTGVKTDVSRLPTPIKDLEKGGKVEKENKTGLFEKVKKAFQKIQNTLNTYNLNDFLAQSGITKDDFFKFMLSEDGLSFVNKLSPNLISELINKAGDKKSREFAFNKLINKNLINDNALKLILSEDKNFDLWVVLWKDNFDQFSQVFDKFSLFERQKILLTNFDAFTELIRDSYKYEKRGFEGQIKDTASIKIIGDTLDFEQMLMSNDKTKEIVEFLKLFSMSIHLENTLKEYVNQINNLTAKNLILQMLKDGLQNDPQAEYLTKIFLKKLGLQDDQLENALVKLKSISNLEDLNAVITNFKSSVIAGVDNTSKRISENPVIFGDEGTGHQFDELPELEF